MAGLKPQEDSLFLGKKSLSPEQFKYQSSRNQGIGDNLQYCKNKMWIFWSTSDATDSSENIGKYSFELHLMVSVSLLFRLTLFLINCGGNSILR